MRTDANQQFETDKRLNISKSNTEGYMNKVIKVALLLMVLTSPPATNSYATDECKEYGDKKEYDKEIAACTDVIGSPNYKQHVAYYNRGTAYAGKEQYDQAIADYNKAIELNPKYDAAYNNRGAAYVGKKQYDQAIADCNKAIELNPQSGPSYVNRCDAYKYKGLYDQAIADCNKAIELNSKNHVAYYNMATIFAAQNNAANTCHWLKLDIKAGDNNYDFMKKDKDFDNIRNSECFKRIIYPK